MKDFSIGNTVALKRTGERVGIITRFMGTNILVKGDDPEPAIYKPSRLVIVKKGRSAKASAPAGDKKDSVIGERTRQIQVKITGTTNAGPNWRLIARTFTTVQDARAYLETFKLIDIDGRHAMLETPAEAKVYTNYDIEDILASNDPDSDLPVILNNDVQRPIIMPERRASEVHVEVNGKVATASSPKVKSSSSSLIALKTICSDISMEPREARVRLRSLAKKPGVLPIAHAAQGRWEWEPVQVDTVKALLKGDKPAKGIKPATGIAAKRHNVEEEATKEHQLLLPWQIRPAQKGDPVAKHVRDRKETTVERTPDPKREANPKKLAIKRTAMTARQQAEHEFKQSMSKRTAKKAKKSSKKKAR